MFDVATIDDPQQPSRPRGNSRPVPPATPAPLASPASRPSRAAARSRRVHSITSGLASGLAGFVIGAVFWHFVGFWSFVSNVILKGHEEPAQQHSDVPPPQQPVKVAGRLKDAVRFRDLGASASYLQAAVGAGNCAEVRMERGSSQASVQACTLSAAQLPTTGQGQRGDRLGDIAATTPRAVPSGWSVQVQAGD